MTAGTTVAGGVDCCGAATIVATSASTAVRVAASAPVSGRAASCAERARSSATTSELAVGGGGGRGGGRGAGGDGKGAGVGGTVEAGDAVGVERLGAIWVRTLASRELGVEGGRGTVRALLEAAVGAAGSRSMMTVRAASSCAKEEKAARAWKDARKCMVMGQ